MREIIDQIQSTRRSKDQEAEASLSTKQLEDAMSNEEMVKILKSIEDAITTIYVDLSDSFSKIFDHHEQLLEVLTPKSDSSSGNNPEGNSSTEEGDGDEEEKGLYSVVKDAFDDISKSLRSFGKDNKGILSFLLGGLALANPEKTLALFQQTISDISEVMRGILDIFSGDILGGLDKMTDSLVGVGVLIYGIAKTVKLLSSAWATIDKLTFGLLNKGTKALGKAIAGSKLGTLTKTYASKLFDTTKHLAKAAGSKIVAIARAIPPLMMGLGGSLMSAASVLGTAVATFLPVIGVVAAIAAVGYGLYKSVKEAFKAFTDVYEATGSIGEALKVGVATFVANFAGFIPNMFKDLISWILGALGFEELSAKLDSFNFVDEFIEIITGVFDSIIDMAKMLNPLNWFSGDEEEKTKAEPKDEPKAEPKAEPKDEPRTTRRSKYGSYRATKDSDKIVTMASGLDSEQDVPKVERKPAQADQLENVQVTAVRKDNVLQFTPRTKTNVSTEEFSNSVATMANTEAEIAKINSQLAEISSAMTNRATFEGMTTREEVQSKKTELLDQARVLEKKREELRLVSKKAEVTADAVLATSKSVTKLETTTTGRNVVERKTNAKTLAESRKAVTTEQKKSQAVQDATRQLINEGVIGHADLELSTEQQAALDKRTNELMSNTLAAPATKPTSSLIMSQAQNNAAKANVEAARDAVSVTTASNVSNAKSTNVSNNNVTNITEQAPRAAVSSTTRALVG